MLNQRIAQQSLRKLVFQHPSTFARSSLIRTGPLAISQRQTRVASTTTTSTQEKVSLDEGYNILVKQRLNRPVSPHLGIYRPQITWYASAANRLTGCVVSGAFYIFGFGYLIQPLLGVHIFESSSIIGAFAGMALWAKIPIKFTAAFFFMFHSFNGVRHLTWDAGKGIKNGAVIRSGWFVVGLSAVVSAWLAFM